MEKWIRARYQPNLPLEGDRRVCTAMTVAPTSGSPAWSVTVPFSPEVVTCAKSAPAAKRESIESKSFFIR